MKNVVYGQLSASSDKLTVFSYSCFNFKMWYFSSETHCNTSRLSSCNFLSKNSCYFVLSFLFVQPLKLTQNWNYIRKTEMKNEIDVKNWNLNQAAASPQPGTKTVCRAVIRRWRKSDAGIIIGLIWQYSDFLSRMRRAAWRYNRIIYDVLSDCVWPIQLRYWLNKTHHPHCYTAPSALFCFIAHGWPVMSSLILGLVTI